MSVRRRAVCASLLADVNRASLPPKCPTSFARLPRPRTHARTHAHSHTHTEHIVRPSQIRCRFVERETVASSAVCCSGCRQGGDSDYKDEIESSLSFYEQRACIYIYIYIYIYIAVAPSIDKIVKSFSLILDSSFDRGSSRRRCRRMRHSTMFESRWRRVVRYRAWQCESHAIS